MSHLRSLRVIGQSLEVARIQTFELETDGPNYIVKSDSLTQTGEWILRHALSPNDNFIFRQSTVSRSVRFSAADIARLDDQAQKQRRNNSSSEVYARLSQLLRTLGDHLDRTKVGGFHISWASDAVLVDFQWPDGETDSRTFSAEKLVQLGSSLRFRRSSLTRSDSSLRGSPNQTKPRNR